MNPQNISTLAAAIVCLVCAGSMDVSASECDLRTQYKCSNGRCIPRASVNNSFNDCGDNSDEVVHPCRSPMYSCRNDRCILLEWVLDGKDDCMDKSDEVKTIGTRCRPSGTCCPCHEFVAHSECHQNVCRCESGYQSNELGTKCRPRQVGSKCRHDAACTSVVINSHCDVRLSTCVCNADLSPSDDGLRCLSATSRYSLSRQDLDVAIVSVSIVVLLVLLFVDVFLVFWLFLAFVCRPASVPSTPPTCRQLVCAVVCRPSAASDRN